MKSEENQRIDLSSFKSWVIAVDLSEQVYLCTKNFPKDELYGITNQLRRAAVSVSANLAEGYGRQSKADKEHFYVIARGSLYETRSLIEVAKRVGYLDQSQYNTLNQVISKNINFIMALIKTHRNKK